MRYVTLGESGLVVSRLCFGAMTFGSGDFHGFRFNVDEALADRMVGAAIERGINFFDTADLYAAGQSEQILGHVLKDRRKDVIIATKFASRQGPAPTNFGGSYGHVVAAAEASLARLGTDYIDLYQAHFDDRFTPLEETLRALEDLQRRGLVRYVGFSNWPAWWAQKAIGIQERRGFAPLCSAQLYYSLLGREVEHELVPLLRDAGVGMMVWSPLAGGFLSGKYTREDPTGGGGRLTKFSFPAIDRERGYDVVDAVRAVAEAHGASCAAVSLAWLLHKPAVSSVIVGATRLQHLDDNLAAVDLELTREEMAALDEASRIAPIYPGWMYANGPSDPIARQVARR